MKKSIHALLIAVTILLLPAQRLAAETGPPGSVLDELVAAALENNPDIQAGQARWRLFQHKIRPAASLNDPALSFAFSNYPVDTFANGNTPMTGNIVRLAQEFPFPGKLAARETAAAEEAKWYQGLWEDARLQLIRQVKEAYFNLYFAEKALAITDRNLTLLQDVIRLSEVNYEVGKGLQQDVLKAQVEYARLADNRFTLQQKREVAMAELNRLLGRPSFTKLERLDDFGLPDMNTTLEALQEQTDTSRPLAAAYKSLVESYKAKQEMARLNYLPDFRLGVAYTFREPNPADSGTDFASLEFGINLPIYLGKRHAAVEESSAGLRMALEQYRDFRDKVRFNIHDSYSALERSRQQTLLFRTSIIPQATQAFEASLSAYRVGKTSFTMLLDSLMILQNLEMEYFRRLTDGQRSSARLEAESGATLTYPVTAATPAGPTLRGAL